MTTFKARPTKECFLSCRQENINDLTKNISPGVWRKKTFLGATYKSRTHQNFSATYTVKIGLRNLGASKIPLVLLSSNKIAKTHRNLLILVLEKHLHPI